MQYRKNCDDSITCETNLAKFKTLMQDNVRLNAPENFRNRSKGSPLRGDFLPKRGIFHILGPHSHPPAPIEVKFCTAKRTYVPIGRAKFDVNRCNESPRWGKKPDFWPVNKFNTGSLPLCGNPAGNYNKLPCYY